VVAENYGFSLSIRSRRAPGLAAERQGSIIAWIHEGWFFGHRVGAVTPRTKNTPGNASPAIGAREDAHAPGRSSGGTAQGPRSTAGGKFRKRRQRCASYVCRTRIAPSAGGGLRKRITSEGRVVTHTVRSPFFTRTAAVRHSRLPRNTFAATRVVSGTNKKTNPKKNRGAGPKADPVLRVSPQAT